MSNTNNKLDTIPPKSSYYCEGLRYSLNIPVRVVKYKLNIIRITLSFEEVSQWIMQL